MKRVILSSLIIISGCTIDTIEPESIVKEKKTKQATIEENIKEIPPLTLAILKIEDQKTSNDIRQQQIEKIKKISAYNIDAVFYLAALYEEGKLLPLSEKKARNLYQLAAKKNHVLARYYYALMLIDGRGGKKDYHQAKKHLLINHNIPHIPSSYSLGYIYFQEKDYINVISILENKKIPNDIDQYSSYILAVSYLKLNKNKEQSIKLLINSAKKGNINSHQTLGRIYRYGLYNTQVNTEKSYYHLNAAASDNHPKSLYDLATLTIEHPILIENKINIAITQLEKSDKKGYPEASFELAKLYDQGKLIQQDFSQAAQWYVKSASYGNNKAMFNLASMYLNGDGVKISIEKAEYWLQQSASKGNQRAIDILSQE